MENSDEIFRSVTTLLQSGGYRLRLAMGVVGKSTIIVGLFLAFAIIVAWRIAPEFLLQSLEIVAGLVFLWLLGCFVYAHFHPGPALLEGGQLLQWEAIQSAKGQVGVHHGHQLRDPSKPRKRISSEELLASEGDSSEEKA